MSITIQQGASETRPRWWQWSVWLQGDGNDLERVDHVVYHLHPTFPNPDRTVTDAASGFKLTASGWGTFTLGVEIHYRDGTSELRQHPLDFGLAAPSKEQQELGPRSLLLLHDAKDTQEATQIRESLQQLGIEVADSSAVRGGAWSKELTDSIRSFDGLIAIGEADSDTYQIETTIAEKLGKRVVRIDPSAGAISLKGAKNVVESSRNLEDLSRGIVDTFKLR